MTSPDAPVPPRATTAAAEALHEPCICGSDASHEEQMAWATQTATTALEAAAPHFAAAERERIKAAGGVSACCGAEYHREPGRYGRWQCHACGKQCDLIGTIG